MNVAPTRLQQRLSAVEKSYETLQVAGMLDTTEVIKPTERIAAQLIEVAQNITTATQLVRVNRDLVGNPGTQVKIPRRTAHVTAAAVNEGAAISKAQPTYDTVNITPTKVGTGVQVTFEAIEASQFDLINDWLNDAGRAMAVKEDDDIYDTLGGTSRTQAAAVSGTIAYDDVVTAMAALRADNWQPNFLIIHSAHMGDLLKDNKFVNSSSFGDTQPIRDGVIGRFAGLTVVVTNSTPTNFPATTALVLDSAAPSAVHAIKRDMTVRRRENPDTDSVEIYITKLYATARAFSDGTGPIVKITGA